MAIIIDIAKAKDITKDRLRAERKTKLEALDVEFIKAQETGTVAIRESGNVSSITDNNTGDYTVNFTTAMPDINYSATGMVVSAETYVNAGVSVVEISSATAQTTSALRIWTTAMRDANTRTVFDFSTVNVAIFR